MTLFRKILIPCNLGSSHRTYNIKSKISNKISKNDLGKTLIGTPELKKYNK